MRVRDPDSGITWCTDRIAEESQMEVGLFVRRQAVVLVLGRELKRNRIIAGSDHAARITPHSAAILGSMSSLGTGEHPVSVGGGAIGSRVPQRTGPSSAGLRAVAVGARTGRPSPGDYLSA